MDLEGILSGGLSLCSAAKLDQYQSLETAIYDRKTDQCLQLTPLSFSQLV